MANTVSEPVKFEKLHDYVHIILQMCKAMLLLKITQMTMIWTNWINDFFH